MANQKALRRVRLLARATLVAGVAASVAANVLHARNNPISQGIAAWPPLALLLTVELVARVPVHRRSLAAVRIAATTTIASIAAWVSYWHMAGVCARYGETPVSAHLMPLCVDGLVVVASISLVEIAGLLRALDPPTPAGQPAAAPTEAAAAAQSSASLKDGDERGLAGEGQPSTPIAEDSSDRTSPPDHAVQHAPAGIVDRRAPAPAPGPPSDAGPRRVAARRATAVRHPRPPAPLVVGGRPRPGPGRTATAGAASPAGRSLRFDLIEAANGAWIDSTPADPVPPTRLVGQPHRRSTSMTAARTAPVEPADAILAALAHLGQATAVDTATAAGIAYSTATRNLRELAAAGRVQKVQDGKQAQWRLATTADTAGAEEPDADPADKAAPQDSPQNNKPDGDPATAQPNTATAEADAATADGEAGTTVATGEQDEATGTPAPEHTGDDTAPAPATQELTTVPSDSPATDGASTVDTAATPADVPDGGDSATAASTDSGPAAGAPRRASGTLDGAILDVLEAHPGQGFKVSELCKRIDETNQGQDVAKASAGAVVLAAQRLVHKGKAVLAVEKPATFQLVTTAPATADR